MTTWRGDMTKRKQLSQDRIEVRATSEWVQNVDKAAESLGLTRAAFIRLAVEERVRAELAKTLEHLQRKKLADAFDRPDAIQGDFTGEEKYHEDNEGDD